MFFKIFSYYAFITMALFDYLNENLSFWEKMRFVVIPLHQKGLRGSQFIFKFTIQ